MFTSLRARLVLVMILLILSTIAVVGAFLVGSVARYGQDSFALNMKESFERADFMGEMYAAARAEDAPARLKALLHAYSGTLGLDNVQRKYYILDGRTGVYLAGSDDAGGLSLDLTAPSIVAVMREGAPVFSRTLSQNYMDAAVPIAGEGEASYIIYIRDTKESTQELLGRLFSIILSAVLFGLIFAFLLAFLLAGAITRPLVNLTRGVKLVASGTFTSPLEIHSGDEIGKLTGAFNDMTRILRDTLEDIAAERDKLGALFAHMADGVVAFSRDGMLMQANPSAERLLGMPFSEMESYGKLLGRVAPLHDVLGLRQPDFLDRETEIGGRAIRVFLVCFGEAGAEGVMAVLHDVTEQRRLDSLRRDFVSNASHELRTPLTNIRSYAETLAGDEYIPPETARSFSQVILNEADRMNVIVRDLLTLSQFDQGKMNWQMEPFSLKDALRNVYDGMLLEARRRNHSLSLTFEEMPPSITGDRTRIEQVLANILANALKYTPDGGEIEVSCGTEGKQVKIIVRDNGIGIPEADMPRLFERFYRVDKARARESGGTGLGLAIAREIVEKHGGTIEIASAPGKGATVTVSLPIGEEPV